jgi:O-antigen/teichoic acid export membrane protein
MKVLRKKISRILFDLPQGSGLQHFLIFISLGTSKIFTAGTALFAYRVLIDKLGVSSFGLWSMLITYFTVFSLFSNLWSHPARMQVISTEKFGMSSQRNTIAASYAKTSIKMYGILGLIVIPLAVTILEHFNSNADFENLVVIVLLLWLGAALSSASEVVMRSIEASGRFKLVHWIPCLGSLSFLALTLVLPIDSERLVLSIVAITAPSITIFFACLLLIMKSRHEMQAKIPSMDLRVQGYRLGVPYFLISIALYVNYGLDQTLITMTLGNVENAAFALHLKIFQAIQLLGIAIFPLLLREFQLKTTDTVIVFKNGITLFCFTILMGFFLISFAPKIFLFVAKEDIVFDAQLGFAMVFMYALIAFQIPLSATLLNESTIWFQVKTLSIMAACNIPLTLFLLGHFGSVGAVISSIFCFILFQCIPLSIKLIYEKEGSQNNYA